MLHRNVWEECFEQTIVDSISVKLVQATKMHGNVIHKVTARKGEICGMHLVERRWWNCDFANLHIHMRIVELAQEISLHDILSFGNTCSCQCGLHCRGGHASLWLGTPFWRWPRTHWCEVEKVPHDGPTDYDRCFCLRMFQSMKIS